MQKESIKQFKAKFRRTWYGMKYRCTNQKARQYDYYSKRGVSDEWLVFENFYRDMYAEFVLHADENGLHETTLDRKDNAKGYSRENCRWATWAVQFANIDNTNRPPPKQLKLDFSGLSPITEEDWVLLQETNH